MPVFFDTGTETSFFTLALSASVASECSSRSRHIAGALCHRFSDCRIGNDVLGQGHSNTVSSAVRSPASGRGVASSPSTPKGRMRRKKSGITAASMCARQTQCRDPT